MGAFESCEAPVCVAVDKKIASVCTVVDAGEVVKVSVGEPGDLILISDCRSCVFPADVPVDVVGALTAAEGA